MIQFLYTKDYTVENQDDSQESNVETKAKFATMSYALLHVHVHVIADYFDIPGLGLLSFQKLQKHFDSPWATNGFPAFVEEVFRISANEALHALVCRAAAKIVSYLVKVGTLAGPQIPGQFLIGLVTEMQKLNIRKLESQEAEFAKLRKLLTSIESKAELIAKNERNHTSFREAVTKFHNRISGSEFGRHCKQLKFFIETCGTVEDPSFILRCQICLSEL
jgi:hypothetical protein